MLVGEDIGEKEKMALVADKIAQKGKLSMDPMVESSWRSKEYLTPIEETVSLVGKSTGMPSTTSGFQTLDCWGWSNEIGSTTTILRQKAPKGASLANPDGLLHAF